jgi:hypothetical protein
LKTYKSLGRIEPEVTLVQWLTALLVVVMMLQHYTRFVPFPQDAPARADDIEGNSETMEEPLIEVPRSAG